MNSLSTGRLRVVAGALGCLIFALIGSVTVGPAFAGRSRSAIVTIKSQTCNSQMQCLQETNNNGRGSGIRGNANGGIGVYGTTKSSNPEFGSAAVFGEDSGTLSVGSGVTGFSSTGTGLEGDNFQHGQYFNTGSYGLSFLSSVTTYYPARPSGGVFVSDTGEGVVAETDAAQAEALTAANFGGGPVMRGYENSTEVMELDHAGNMILSGTLTQQGNPGAVAHRSGASDVVMYSPAEALATVEDMGEARLTLGSADVRLDPRFGGTMDRGRPYMVFLTPQGDTAGLYVTRKTADGFTVREHAGRSNIAFDYRIVAQPYGSRATRLPDAPRLLAHGFSGSFTRHKSSLLHDR
jgi:hypothetical protein